MAAIDTALIGMQHATDQLLQWQRGDLVSAGAATALPSPEPRQHIRDVCSFGATVATVSSPAVNWVPTTLGLWREQDGVLDVQHHVALNGVAAACVAAAQHEVVLGQGSCVTSVDVQSGAVKAEHEMVSGSTESRQLPSYFQWRACGLDGAGVGCKHGLLLLHTSQWCS